MKNCPDCGRELSDENTPCPSCKPAAKPFTIRQFLWENFRLFTLIGITGTMISLIPNMGNRILGTAWIASEESYLPLFLSMILFFGAIFLTICFLMIFGLIFEGRKNEEIHWKPAIRSRPLFTVYKGDFQRFILLLCLVPMWFGLLMFFVMVMPLIPNRYSWVFAMLMILTFVPLALYSFLGWKIGKSVNRITGSRTKSPRLVVAGFGILVVLVLILIPYAIDGFSGSGNAFSDPIGIRADHEYFSPHISSAKGLRLVITNVSGTELLASRQTWSADYGYFVRVIPSTSEVIILGNPVQDATNRDIYWTWSETDAKPKRDPVKIDLQITKTGNAATTANASLYLSWYTRDIVQVNTSRASGVSPA